MTREDLEAVLSETSRRIRAEEGRDFDSALASALVERGVLTRFQAAQLLAGKRKLTLGQYRILDAVGQGGMGQVFKGRHVLMGRDVAVKVLPRDRSNPRTEAAFRREIQHIASLDHRNLVYALDAGHDGKVYFLVTELVDGIDLRRQVIRYGPLDETAAASVISQAALGLAHAHARGFIHRDVKPGNILVRADGFVKVSDLGLAGSVLDPESLKPGRVVGTIDYMAPEQILHPEAVQPAADVYGLGCTLYFTLSGRVPFPGGSRQEKRHRQLHDEPTAIQILTPTISLAFARILERMMAKDVSRRIQSADEVVEALRPWLTGEPVKMPRERKGSRRHASNSPSSGSFSTHLFSSASPHMSTGMYGSSAVSSGAAPIVPWAGEHFGSRGAEQGPPDAMAFLLETVRGLQRRLLAAASIVLGSIMVALFIAIGWWGMRAVGGEACERLLASLELDGLSAARVGWHAFLLALALQAIGSLRLWLSRR